MLSLVWWHLSLHMRVLAVYLIGLLLLASRQPPHWLTGVIVIHFQSSAKELYVTLWMSLASLRAILYWVLLSEWLLFYVLTLCSTPYLWAHGALRYRHKQHDEAPNIYFLHWVLFSHDILRVQYKYWKIIATEEKKYCWDLSMYLCAMYLLMNSQPQIICKFLYFRRYSVLYQRKHLSWTFKVPSRVLS